MRKSTRETALAGIRGAIRTLSAPSAWCVRDMARNASGRSVLFFDPEACRWSLNGAICKNTPGDAPRRVIFEWFRRMFGQWPRDWNDTRGRQHADVLRALTRMESEFARERAP